MSGLLSIINRRFARVSIHTCILSFGISSGIYAQASNPVGSTNLCKKYLDTGGAPLESSNLSYQRIQPFLQILHRVAKAPAVNWPTPTIQPQARVVPARAQALMAQFKNPDSDIHKEMGAHIRDLGGADGEALWNKYLTAYDKIVGFTRGFWDLAFAMDEIMPKTGRLADFGAGTGNISTILSIASPERFIDVLDFSNQGLAIAKEKFPLIPKYDSTRLHAERFDLTKDDYPANTYDGAVMNNVLYNLPSEQKLAVLKNILRSLKPGAPFVLSDIIQSSQEQLENFLSSTVVDALQAGSPVTEYDMVLMGKINTSVLLQGRFLTLGQLKQLAQEAGFEVRGIFKSYYDVAGFLYLTKPRQSLTN